MLFKVTDEGQLLVPMMTAFPTEENRVRAEIFRAYDPESKRLSEPHWMPLLLWQRLGWIEKTTRGEAWGRAVWWLLLMLFFAVMVLSIIALLILNAAQVQPRSINWPGAIPLTLFAVSGFVLSLYRWVRKATRWEVDLG